MKKHFLIMNIALIVLSLCLLTDVTYAWFDYSVASLNNTIDAGELDFYVEYRNEQGTWLSKDNGVFLDLLNDDIAFGKVSYIKITNNGDIDIKNKIEANLRSDDLCIENMKVAIQKLDNDEETIDVDNLIDEESVTNTLSKDDLVPVGESSWYALIVYLLENDANNDMSGTLSIDIDIIAMQSEGDFDDMEIENVDDETYAKDDTGSKDINEIINKALESGVNEDEG